MGIGCVLYYIALRVRTINANKYLQYLLLIVGLIGYSVLIYMVLIKEKNTIRFISIHHTINNLGLLNVVAGNGIGSYLMDGFSEAYVFHVFYEQGLIGVFMLLFPMIQYLLIQQRNKNYGGVIFILTVMLNCVINEGYAIPYLFAIVPITYIGNQRILANR